MHVSTLYKYAISHHIFIPIVAMHMFTVLIKFIEMAQEDSNGSDGVLGPSRKLG